MRMTIDGSIKGLHDIQNYYNDDREYLGFDKIDNESVDVAIKTLQKYQKMQKVLERIWNIPSHLIDKEQCLDRIMETYKEVRVEDGKID